MATLLDEARDPATPANRLYALSVWSNNVEIMRAVAGNPNAPASALSGLSMVGYGQWVLENPVLPLLFLEGDWSQWTFEGVRDLRLAAYNLGHPLFPSLASACHESWHYGESWQHLRIAKCDSRMCARCYPEDSRELLVTWKIRKAHKEQTNGNQ